MAAPSHALRLALLLLLSSCAVSPERAELRFNGRTVLSEDPAVARSLESSLLLFLEEARTGAFTDSCVDPEELARHGFFFDGLRAPRLRAGAAWDAPMVLRSYSFDGRTHLVTVAFGGTVDGEQVLRKVVELEARPHGEGYRFTSPFDRRVANLERTEIGTVTFRHRGSLDEAAARRFAGLREEFSAKTRTPCPPLEYFCFQSLDDLLRAFGFVYDSTKCNFLAHDLGFSSPDGRRFYTGTDDPAYVFEYVGEHLAQHLGETGELYSPALVGYSAYLGGYSLSGDDIDTLAAQFRRALEDEPSMDLLEEYRKGRGSSVERHFSHFVMCAFLCREAEARGGFESVRRLLQCGSEGERFFEVLEQELGVTEASFHDSIVAMIAA